MRPVIHVREQVYEGRRKKLKTSYSVRDLPLSPAMTARLLAHRSAAKNAGEEAPVFPSGSGTELRPANVYRRVLAPAAIAVGLSEEVEGEDGKPRTKSAISFHTFRHTCASLLFEAGKDVKQVQEWLGHGDPGFTLRTYVHLLDNGVGSAEFFDSVLTASPRSVASEPAEEVRLGARAGGAGSTG
jgi:integrase